MSYAEYGDVVRDQLFLLKYQHQRETGTHLLGARLAQAIVTMRGDMSAEVMVVPVPLYFARERERGFNQALLLARGVLVRLKRTAPEWKLSLATNVLERVKPTPALFSLSPKQRRERLQGAFKVIAPEAVKGREVLLIDDIMTTGSTARECARVLKRAGAAKVFVATVARAQPHGSAWMHDASAEAHAVPAGVAMWDGGGAPVH
ncbi:ComF family protein [Granulicella cerasi]|uniref:ComF family protein n=1 Tax=Granulicella cerasi TaxID=741063 RepID=A0ABW1ZCW0_9BACT